MTASWAQKHVQQQKRKQQKDMKNMWGSRGEY